MKEIKIRSLHKCEEFPWMSPSQAKFNALGDLLGAPSPEQAKWEWRECPSLKGSPAEEPYGLKLLVCKAPRTRKGPGWGLFSASHL